MPEKARRAGTAIAWCPSSTEGAAGRGRGLQPLHQAPGLFCMELMVPHEDHGWEEKASATPYTGGAGAGSAKLGSGEAQWER